MDSDLIEAAESHELIQDNEANQEFDVKPELAKFLVQCSECQNIFTPNDFREHICEMDIGEVEESTINLTFSGNNLIVTEFVEEVPIPPPTSLLHHPCMALLEDNETRLRKFMKDELKVNLPEQQGGRSNGLECDTCFRKFNNKAALLKHVARHDSDPKDGGGKMVFRGGSTNQSEALLKYDICFVCLVCGRAFANIQQVEEHLYNSDCHSEIEEQGQMIKQEVNPIELPEEEVQEMRMDAIVLKLIYQCEFCDYVFARKEDLLKHEATHDPQLGYICSSCEINTMSMKEIQQHWQQHCPFRRGRSSTKHEQWSVELTTIRLTTDYVCNVCFETFPSLDILYDHRHKKNHYFPRYSHVNEEELLMGCEVCGNLYDNCVKYCEHFEDNHTKRFRALAMSKTRQYLCDVCGKTYTQSSHLWQHLRFHQGVKPFQCTFEGCDRRFTIRPDLNDHIRKFHTHERPYQCLVCGKRFLTGSVFYQHRLIHRGERRYECTTCSKRFFRADALKNHNRIHTGEKPYPCLVCAKKFRQRGDCQKHMEARHMKR